jgi:hypothetical protein
MMRVAVVRDTPLGVLAPDIGEFHRAILCFAIFPSQWVY